MSEELKKALDEGRELTRDELMQLIEFEAVQAGVGGAKNALRRMRSQVPIKNFLEADVRSLAGMLPYYA